jgi:GcrA cell cycle regulator
MGFDLNEMTSDGHLRFLHRVNGRVVITSSKRRNGPTTLNAWRDYADRPVIRLQIREMISMPWDNANAAKEWSDDQIERLRALWNEGISTLAISRQLGHSKNSVIGKVHRLCLPRRPSPIHQSDPLNPRAAEYERRRSQRRSHHRVVRIEPELPPLPALDFIPPRPPPYIAPPEPRQPEPHTEPRHEYPGPGSCECRWPMWNNDARPTHQFCCSPAVTSKVYCPDHCRVAYQGMRSA